MNLSELVSGFELATTRVLASKSTKVRASKSTHLLTIRGGRGVVAREQAHLTLQLAFPPVRFILGYNSNDVILDKGQLVFIQCLIVKQSYDTFWRGIGELVIN